MKVTYSINLNSESHEIYYVLREAMYKYLLSKNLIKVTPLKEMNHSFSERNGAFFITTEGYGTNYTLKLYGPEISLDIDHKVVSKMDLDIEQQLFPEEWVNLIYSFMVKE